MNIFSQITNMISSNLNIMFLESVFDYIIASIFRISCYILNLVKLILNLIFDLAGTDFFSAEAIGDIGKRLYVLLGIFMLIKITISCVTYLINPDKSDDKENGFGSIIKRTVISLLLLLAVPSVFNFAKQAQIAIVDTLPKIILGNAGNVDIDDVGERIAYSTMLAFVDYTEGCNDGSIAGRPDANGQIVDYQNGAGNIKVYSMDSLINNAGEMISATCGSKKRYEVLWYLAPLVAGYLVFMLVSMAFYVGIRTIKFGFLQLIAPIPIASYVDPKSSKKSFDSWVHNCVSVYIDLFIRLGVIYLMIYLFEIVLGSISSSVVVYGETIGGPRVAFIKLFIILSIILFAKEAPKFISDVLGIKAEGSISEMFKRGGGLAGASVAGLKTGLSNFVSQKERLKSQGKKGASLRAALSAGAGATSATLRGAKMAAFDKKGFKDVQNGAFKKAISKRDQRNDRVDNVYQNGYDYFDFKKASYRSKLGIPLAEDFTVTKAKEMNSTMKIIADAKSHGATKMIEEPDRYQVALSENDKDQKFIIDQFGIKSLSVAQIRNLVKEAGNNDGKVRISDGKGGHIEKVLDYAQRAQLDKVQQSIEKKTALITEVGLMALGDPTSSKSLDNLYDKLKNNSTMFDPEIMKIISTAMNEKGIVVNNLDDIMKQVEILKTHVSSDDPNFNEIMSKRSKILDGLKGGFEQVDTHMNRINIEAERQMKNIKNAVNNANNDKK